MPERYVRQGRKRLPKESRSFYPSEQQRDRDSSAFHRAGRGPAGFDELAAQGKATLVAVHADWCPTCKAQKPIVSELLGKPEFKDVTALVVDFDAQKPIVPHYKVATQSTLIAFKAGKEVGRSVGDPTKNGVEGVVKKTAN
jgi:thioredoxin 1